MPEIGVPYSIVGPDGTRAVFQDSSDIDFVGFLTGDSAVTFVKSVRATADDLVEEDGSAFGNSYYGPLVVTMNGMIYADTSIATIDQLERKLFRASAAMRADSIIRWTPSTGEARRVLVRRQQDVQVTGLRPKRFLLSFVSANPFVEADSESSLTLNSLGGGEAGISSPITNPITSAFTVTGQTLASNVGDVACWPRFEFVGPIQNPAVLNNTTGASVRFLVNLAAGETLSVDTSPTRGRHVLYNGAAAYGAYDYITSTWWQLIPGANDVRLSSFSSGVGSSATMFWRSQWEV